MAGGRNKRSSQLRRKRRSRSKTKRKMAVLSPVVRARRSLEWESSNMLRGSTPERVRRRRAAQRGGAGLARDKFIKRIASKRRIQGDMRDV